jgi:hypothetical protein
MPDLDLMAHGRLVYFARLLPHARDADELREFVTECRAALTALEPRRQPEPMPLHISCDLFPAQGASPEAVCDRILTASGESLRREEDEQPSLVVWDAGDVPRLVPVATLTPETERELETAWREAVAARNGRTIIEAGAGFAPGELARVVWGGVEEREQ